MINLILTLFCHNFLQCKNVLAYPLMSISTMILSWILRHYRLCSSHYSLRQIVRRKRGNLEIFAFFVSQGWKVGVYLRSWLFLNLILNVEILIWYGGFWLFMPCQITHQFYSLLLPLGGVLRGWEFVSNCRRLVSWFAQIKQILLISWIIVLITIILR